MNFAFTFFFSQILDLMLLHTINDQCLFFFWRIFGDKKKGLANPTNGFLRFKKTNSPYLDQKNLEVARFR
jgi:hypothetical protein